MAIQSAHSAPRLPVTVLSGFLGARKTVETVKELMSRTSTKTGLTLFASILGFDFALGCKVEANFKQPMTIVLDLFLPQWNYVARPLHA